MVSEVAFVDSVTDDSKIGGATRRKIVSHQDPHLLGSVPVFHLSENSR